GGSPGGWRGGGGFGAVELEVVHVVHVTGDVVRGVTGAGAGPAGRALRVVGHAADSNASRAGLRTPDLAAYHGVPYDLAQWVRRRRGRGHCRRRMTRRWSGGRWTRIRGSFSSRRRRRRSTSTS